MKYSLTLRPRRALNRSEARACLAANIALPGAGSLAAGRAVGYWQMATAFGGFIITILTGIPMIRWCLANWPRLNDPLTGLDLLPDLLRQAFFPMIGIGVFVAGILWSISTGLQLVAQAPKDGVPPRIEP